MVDIRTHQNTKNITILGAYTKHAKNVKRNDRDKQDTQLNAEWLYSVSQKNPPYGFLKFFPKRLGTFNHFYTHILLSFLH